VIEAADESVVGLLMPGAGFESRTGGVCRNDVRSGAWTGVDGKSDDRGKSEGAATMATRQVKAGG